MAGVRRLAHEICVAARIAGRTLRARAAGRPGATADTAAFRADLTHWVAGLRDDAPRRHRFCELSAAQPPWRDTGLDLQAGDTVTWFGHGRFYLSKLLDLSVGPALLLWARVGDGPVFRGTRDTHTFTASRAGRLWLGSCFPGEWADRTGRLEGPAAGYPRASGALSVLLLHWSRGADVPRRLQALAAAADAPQAVKNEAQRLESGVPTPADWDYLWFLGPGEIFQPAAAQGQAPRLGCHTHGDVGILHHDAALPLEPGTRLRWSWRVDELPTDLPEDTLASHDYLSVAVEFDDGQDITYYWSSSLPVGTAYRCPLPNWAGRETHVVVRSGAAELGRWVSEERDVAADYHRLIGGTARSVVRVWLIAMSLASRRHGRCEYADIVLSGPAGALRVL